MANDACHNAGDQEIAPMDGERCSLIRGRSGDRPYGWRTMLVITRAIRRSPLRMATMLVNTRAIRRSFLRMANDARQYAGDQEIAPTPHIVAASIARHRGQRGHCGHCGEQCSPLQYGERCSPLRYAVVGRRCAVRNTSKSLPLWGRCRAQRGG